MSDTHQAEDIRQLTEKIKEQNYLFSLLRQEINKVIIGQEYMIDRLLENYCELVTKSTIKSLVK